MTKQIFFIYPVLLFAKNYFTLSLSKPSPYTPITEL